MRLSKRAQVVAACLMLGSCNTGGAEPFAPLPIDASAQEVFDRASALLESARVEPVEPASSFYSGVRSETIKGTITTICDGHPVVGKLIHDTSLVVNLEPLSWRAGGVEVVVFSYAFGAGSSYYVAVADEPQGCATLDDISTKLDAPPELSTSGQRDAAAALLAFLAYKKTYDEQGFAYTGDVDAKLRTRMQFTLANYLADKRPELVNSFAPTAADREADASAEGPSRDEQERPARWYFAATKLARCIPMDQVFGDTSSPEELEALYVMQHMPVRLVRQDGTIAILDDPTSDEPPPMVLVNGAAACWTVMAKLGIEAPYPE